MNCNTFYKQCFILFAYPTKYNPLYNGIDQAKKQLKLVILQKYSAWKKIELQVSIAKNTLSQDFPTLKSRLFFCLISNQVCCTKDTIIFGKVGGYKKSTFSGAIGKTPILKVIISLF